MIEIELPDGTIVEFPDSMTPQQIETVLSQQFGAPEPARSPAPITGGDLVRSGLQGATFGFGDEARAGVSAGLGALMGQGSYSDLYQATRDSERQRDAQFSQDHPVASGIAEVGGGLLTGALGGAKAAGTTAGRKLAANVAQRGVLGRMGAASVIGGAGGGVGGAAAGAGHAEELSDVPGAMKRGGLLGTATGAIAGPIFEGAATGFRTAKNAIKRARDPQLQAAKTVERSIQRSGLTPDEALERANAMGPKGILAESGDAPKRALENVTQQEGPARDMALKQLHRRSVKQGGELLEDLGPGRKYETLDALKKAREEDASPLYERAFKQDVPHTSALEKIFNDLEEYIPGIWRDAKKLGKLSLSNKGQKLPESAMGTARPSLRGWQYIKEQLDDKVDSLYRTGNSKAGSALKETKERLLTELDTLNPAYGEARAKWAGLAQFEDMMDSADRFMTISPAQFESAMKKLTPIDKEAVRISAVQAIEEKIQKGQWTHDVAKLFRTPAMERKMRALFDNTKDFARFQNKITASTLQQSTYDAVRGQSATARRLAAAQEGNDWIAKLIEGVQSPKASLLDVAARKANMLRPSMSEKARTATAELLLEQDPVTRQLNMMYGQGLLNAPIPKPGSPLMPGLLGGASTIPGSLLGR